jgi:hypothetical protein
MNSRSVARVADIASYIKDVDGRDKPGHDDVGDSRPAPVLKQRMCYSISMTKDQLKEILDRVLTWPPERQADVAHMVELMEKQDRSMLRHTGEQLAEVRRRRAKKNPKYVSLADARKRFRG